MANRKPINLTRDSDDWRDLQMAELKRRFGDNADVRAEAKAPLRAEPPRPKGPNHPAYFKAIEEARVVLCTGPAGTGKTFIPAGLGACWLHAGRVQKLLLTRPQVTCSAPNSGGMGFFPGDPVEKISPYLRPLLDVVKKFLDGNDLNRRLRDGSVELAALDLLRGASLENTLVVADEMQNCTREQLRMLLTRIGRGSTVVVSGDVTQSDLHGGGEGPLAHAVRRLARVPKVRCVRLTHEDQCRDPLVSAIDVALSAPEADGPDHLLVGRDAWYAVRCPACNAANWYSNGDEEDPRVPDVEQILCWGCGNYPQVPESGEPKAAPSTPAAGHCTAGAPRPPRS